MRLCLVFLFLSVSGGLAAERKEGEQSARRNTNSKVQNAHPKRASTESEALKPKDPPKKAKSYSDDEHGVQVPFGHLVKVEMHYPVFVPHPYSVYIERKAPFVVKVPVPQAFAKALSPEVFTSSGGLQQGVFQAKKIQYSRGEKAPAVMKMQEENPVETAESQRSPFVFSEKNNLFDPNNPFEEKGEKKVFQQSLRGVKSEIAPTMGLTYWTTKNARPQNGRPQKAISYSLRRESGISFRRAPQVREETGEDPVEVDWSQMGRAQKVEEAMAQKAMQEAMEQKAMQEAMEQKAMQEAMEQKAMQEAMAQKAMQEAMAQKAMQEAMAQRSMKAMAQKSMEAMTQAITQKAAEEAMAQNAMSQKAMQQAMTQKSMPEAMSQKMQQAMAQQTMQEEMAPREMVQNGMPEDQEYGAMEGLEGQKEGGNVFNDDAEVVSTTVKVINPEEREERQRGASYTHSSYTAIGKLVGFTTTVQHHPE